MENELEKEWREIEFDKNAPEKSFCKRAHFLMNKISLLAGDNEYRVVDCEVYYNDDKNHPDPFLHSKINKHKNQQKPNHWFFNDAGGIDLTFGSEQQNIYGSVLIRAIENRNRSESEKYTTGIMRVMYKLLNHLPSAFDSENWIKLKPLHDLNDPIFKCRRWNLRREIPDPNDYRNRAYRYILESFLKEIATAPEIKKRRFMSRPNKEYVFEPKICNT